MEQRIEFNSLVQIINRTVPGGADVLRGHLTQLANHHLVNARDPNPVQQGRTLLHYAVLARNLECTQVLLDCGAKTFISDINFCTPLTYATQNNPNIECVTLLLRNLTTFKSADLDEIITFALEHYKPENDGDNTHNLLVSAFCVSLLTGLNLEPELRDNQNKFFGHICSIKGYYIQGSIAGTAVGPNENNRLEWWHQYQFLSTRLRILFHLLLKISWNYTHEVENDNRRLRVELVKKEFCITIETFHILWAAYHIDSLANKINFLRDNVRQIQDSLYVVLSKNVIDRIRVLENGELVLAVRYVNPGHSIYVAFQKINGIVLKRVDNLGDGVLEMQGARILSWRHATTVDNLIYPFVYSQRQQNEYNETNQDELSYISDCIKFSVINYEKAEVINRIYSSALRQGGLRFDQLNLTALYPQALSCNCVVESYLPGTKNRTRENCDWLLSEERTLASPNLTLRVELRYPVTGVQYLQQRKIPVHILKVFCNDIENKYNTVQSNTREYGFRIENVVFNLRKESTPTFKEEERENERAFFATALVNQDHVEIGGILSPNDDRAQSVLIEGPAGYGKTTLCLSILYQWAKNQNRLWKEFDLICYIPLRNLNSEKYPRRNNPYTLSEIIQKECFEDIVGNIFLDSKLEELIKNNKVLWILDGYDELELPSQGYLNTVWDNLIKLARFRVITTRPYRKPTAEINITRTLHMAPYRQEHIDRFIDDYFVGNDIPKRATLKTFLRSASGVRPHVRTPGNLSMLCMLWGADQVQLGNNPQIAITRLFYEFLKLSMSLTLEKAGFRGAQQNPRQLFVLSGEVMKSYQRLAYYMKLNNQREISLQTLTRYLGKRIDLDLIGSMREYGFIIQTGTAENPLYEFSHSSILDFFCAWYMYQKLSSSHFREVLQYISDNKYNNNFTLVLRFLSGFVHQQFVGISMMDQTIRDRLKRNFWTVIDSRPRELFNYHQVKLWIALLQETVPETIAQDFDGKLRIIAGYSQATLPFIYDEVGACEVELIEDSRDLATTLSESPAVLDCLIRRNNIFDAFMQNILSGGALRGAAWIKVLTRFVGSSSLNHEIFKQKIIECYRSGYVTIRFSVLHGLLRLAREGMLLLNDINQLMPINEDKYSGRYFEVMKIFSACSNVIASDVGCTNRVLQCITEEAILSPLHRSQTTGLYRFDAGLEAYYNVLSEIPGGQIDRNLVESTVSRLFCESEQMITIDFYDLKSIDDRARLNWIMRILLVLINKNRHDMVLNILNAIGNNLNQNTQNAARINRDLSFFLSLLIYGVQFEHNHSTALKSLFLQIRNKNEPNDNIVIASEILFRSATYSHGLFEKPRLLLELCEILRRALALDFAFENTTVQYFALKMVSKLSDGINREAFRQILVEFYGRVQQSSEFVKRDFTEPLRSSYAACQFPFVDFGVPPLPIFQLPAFPAMAIQPQATPDASLIAELQRTFNMFIENPNDTKAGAALINKIIGGGRLPVIFLTRETLQFRGFPPLVWPNDERGLTAIHAFLYRCFEKLLLRQFLTDDRDQMHITERINLFIQERVLPGAVVMYEDVTTQWQFFTTAPTPLEEKPAPVAQQELLPNPPGGLK